MEDVPAGLRGGPASERPAAPPEQAHPVQADADVVTPQDPPATPPSLLDTEATRRAIRDAARQPLLAERAALAGAERQRPTAQERFGEEVRQAARGDCLKGEYAGGGMGLLSLPFLAAAALREKCAH